MGIAKKTDGRYVVGMGVTDANDYKGSASYRDIYIQLTADGATEESVEYLTYLKDYAVYHSGLGEPIMPPSVNVWISNNGVTTAVEADDLALDGDNFTICGIVWDGSSWDYSDAGKGGGSGLPEVTAEDNGDVLTVVEGEWAKAEPSSAGGLLVTITEQHSPVEALLMDKTFSQIATALNAGVTPMVRKALGGDSTGYTYFVVTYYEEGDVEIEIDIADIGSQTFFDFYAPTSSDYPTHTMENP